MTLWSRAGPNGIPGFSVGKNPGILENEILGFFGICLESVKRLFMVRQDPLPRPVEVKVTHSGEKTNATNVDSSRQFEENCNWCGKCMIFDSALGEHNGCFHCCGHF